MWVVFPLLWQLIEIALFVTLGGAIGLWGTLALVIGSAALGISILRGQGMGSVNQMRQRMAGQTGALEMIAQQMATPLAAILLILPGFLTDTIGLLLLLPPIQLLLARLALARLQRAGAAAGFDNRGHQHQATPDIIEGDWKDITPENPATDASKNLDQSGRDPNRTRH